MTMDNSHIKELTTVFEILKKCLPLGHWKVTLHFSSADEMEDIGSSPTCYGVTKIKEHLEQIQLEQTTLVIMQSHHLNRHQCPWILTAWSENSRARRFPL